jgi:hypothetical protein
MVNEQIDKDLVVTWEEHPTDYAPSMNCMCSAPSATATATS